MSQLDDMFATYAAPAQQHWFGVTVKLKRGPRETSEVPATWSRPPADVDLEGMPLEIKQRTYRIAVSAYVLDGQAVEPMRSDLILETINGACTKFEVLPTGTSPAFELDGDGRNWIIRAKQV